LVQATALVSELDEQFTMYERRNIDRPEKMMEECKLIRFGKSN
jgi:hypothetical protein